MLPLISKGIYVIQFIVRMQHIRLSFEKKYFVLGLINRFYSPLVK